MKVILSIKPEFAEKIFSGDKRFEYRRSIFKNREVSKIIVYASAPISKVVGEFEIVQIKCLDLKTLWRETKELSGITEEFFYEYFKGKKLGFALEIKKARQFKKAKCIVKEYGKIAPQSFVYYNE
jgi:predicted transcriptional regulator